MRHGGGIMLRVALQIINFIKSLNKYVRHFCEFAFIIMHSFVLAYYIVNKTHRSLFTKW